MLHTHAARSEVVQLVVVPLEFDLHWALHTVFDSQLYTLDYFARPVLPGMTA